MRLLMEVLIPVARGNAAVADKSMSAAINRFIDAAKPEAAFFHLKEGKRAAIFIFEEMKQDKLMAHNEAFFAALDAEIWITPTLNLAELQKHL
ncbi:hypothetical protein SAMN04487965_0372 [Microbulbifer donghaiensis]|uniref:Uncharacterized protein n=1 Tax=Microbulbifer donghaiensis TaxID=494016 RepID=A0A1M4VAN3_9GAMM|nr:hypothetical protein [Microbulbifer donghaiensis]SHE65930.1 hypothetical protein SAMN04487965_0372 [Microbulbifer donghaiensis]